MKFRNKAIIILTVIVLATAATVIANYRVTRFLEDHYGVNQQYYSMGEIVPFGDNYLELHSASMDGYAVCVESAEVLTIDELLAQLGQTEDSLSALKITKSDLAEKVCLVSLTLVNDNCSGPGVQLSELHLSGVNYDLFFDNTLTTLANSFLLERYQNEVGSSDQSGAMGVHLDQGTERRIYLVYDFFKGYFSANRWNHLESENLTLDITYFPEKRTIELDVK